MVDGFTAEHAVEVELLLSCARTTVDATTSRRIARCLDQPIDWPRLLHLAREHGVLPLLYQNLRGYPDAVPTATLAELRNRYQAVAQRNLLLAGELVRLWQLLNQQGILAVPFKGLVLAATAYGGLSLRQFVDLDFLIRKPDVSAATEVLVAAGYEVVRQFAPNGRPLPGRLEYEYGFVRPGGPATVELHWALAQPYYAFPVEPDRLWERLCWVELAGQSVPSLAPDDLLLLLCAHGTKHHWRRLRWIADVAQLLRAQPDLPWSTLLARSSRRGAKRMLAIGLLLAQELLDAPVPEDVARIVRSDRGAVAIAQGLRQRLYGDADGPDDIALFSHWYYRSRERTVDRLRYLIGTTSVPWLAEDMPLHARLSLAVRFLPLPRRPATLLHSLLRIVYRAGRRGRRSASSALPWHDRASRRAG